MSASALFAGSCKIASVATGCLSSRPPNLTARQILSVVVAGKVNPANASKRGELPWGLALPRTRIVKRDYEPAPGAAGVQYGAADPNHLPRFVFKIVGTSDT